MSRSYRIHGMDCVDEVTALKRGLAGVVPEEALSFDVLNGKMTVSAPVDEAEVLAAVKSTGMRAEPWVEVAKGTPPAGRSARDWLVVAAAEPRWTSPRSRCSMK